MLFLSALSLGRVFAARDFFGVLQRDIEEISQSLQIKSSPHPTPIDKIPNATGKHSFKFVGVRRFVDALTLDIVIDFNRSSFILISFSSR